MSSPRYERVSGNDEDDTRASLDDNRPGQPIPASPPPSFHSRDSSPAAQRLLSSHDPLMSDAERALADSFDSGSDDEGDDDRGRRADGRRRVQSSGGSAESASEDNGDARDSIGRRPLPRRVTELPYFPSQAASSGPGRGQAGMPRPTNDGVFANLSAKPERGEKTEDQPPSYEQAAADATPPYWETTILAPGVGSDDVFIDGLAVGSVFSFAWNAMISMSFQFVGFLLTYLLHTTHAAKNGSKAGLGITLVQWGLSMKSSLSSNPNSGSGAGPEYSPPTDPNSHDINTASGDAAAAAIAAMIDAQDGTGAVPTSSNSNWSYTNNEWLAYFLMIVGWFILIRSVSNFLRARRHEQLVLQSPDRGLGVPVIAEGERAETVV